jgi:hypothetical protein
MVRGTKLVIDMTTGQSVIETEPGSQNAQPQAAGWSSTAPNAAAPGNRGRPSAILFPNALKDAKEGNKKPPSKPPATGTQWGTQTSPGTATFSD